MDPKELLRRILLERDLNPTSLSRLTKLATKQSQIHRYLAGAVKEPRRSTLQPVADVLGIPVEALLDEAAAASTAAALWGSGDAPGRPAPTPVQPQSDSGHDRPIDAVNALAAHLELLRDDTRDTVAQQLRTLVYAPDSQRAREALAASLTITQPREVSPRKRAGT